MTLPSGVAVVALGLGSDHDIPVVAVTARRGADPADEAPADESEDAPPAEPS